MQIKSLKSQAEIDLRTKIVENIRLMFFMVKTENLFLANIKVKFDLLIASLPKGSYRFGQIRKGFAKGFVKIRGGIIENFRPLVFQATANMIITTNNKAVRLAAC